MDGNTLSTADYTVLGATVTIMGPITGVIEILVDTMPDPFSVTGTVTSQYGGSSLMGVVIHYKIHGGPGASFTDSTATCPMGEYNICACFGQEITILGVSLTEWTLVDAATVLPAGPFNADNIQNFEMYSNVPALTKQYYITATSDGMTAVSPDGMVTLSGGMDKTFTFSAVEGGYISNVKVDGVNLSREEVGLGCYTFSDVNSNHTLQVLGGAYPKPIAILIIDIIEGKGNIQYSANGGPFQAYTGPVPFPSDIDITVSACADNGYEFKEWRDGESVIMTQEYTVCDHAESVKEIQLFFSDTDSSGSLWWIIGALLITAGLLIWFIFFYRRYYDVIKVNGPVKIIGDDRVHRKSEYRFSVEKGYPGIVSYRIGEDGEWKTILHSPEGGYVIPKGEITDTLTIKYL